VVNGSADPAPQGPSTGSIISGVLGYGPRAMNPPALFRLY